MFHTNIIMAQEKINCLQKKSSTGAVPILGGPLCDIVLSFVSECAYGRKQIFQKSIALTLPTDYTYEKAKNKKSNIRELYVRMTKHIFGTILSHNFLKICHTRVRKTRLLSPYRADRKYNIAYFPKLTLEFQEVRK